ncbi:MAG: spermidine/putrescine ABC transporter substrate-binding protein [Deltaproteobacteria bacterium]|nr:spermidine/putrescine ABC transporter substrate-binding protein [Deltaproteobacteria bacterium]
MNLFIWSEYIDLEVISDFEETHNAKVRLDYYESNEEMIAKMQAGRQGTYDIIVPSTYYLTGLISQGLVQPLKRELLTNIGNLAPDFRKIDVDPGNRYSLPYQWGTSGMVILTDDISSITPSWSVLFDPESEPGNFLIFDTARDAIGSALKYLGHSANTIVPEELAEARDLLTATKNRPTFMGFDNGVSGLAKVVSGVASVAQVYNGEAVRASRETPGVHYVLPKEGCEIWVDLLAIPADAPNVELAHEFLNYLLEPEVAAKVAIFNSYATPNQAAMAFIPEEDLNDPGIYPPPELVAKMEYFKDLGAEGRIYDEIWNIVKSR